MSICLNEYDETPWTALKYLIGNFIYGGNITDIWDKRLFDTYTKQLFDENAITTPFHKYDSTRILCKQNIFLYDSRVFPHVVFQRIPSLMDFSVPENDCLQSYKDFVKSLPCEHLDQLVGQHPNANVIYLTRENHLLCETLGHLQKPFNETVHDTDKEKKMLFQLTRILRSLPQLIDCEPVIQNIKMKKNLLNVVLLQEVLFYSSFPKSKPSKTYNN